MKKAIMKTYKCNECDLNYKEEKLARKCEAYCKKYKACNPEIIKQAIKVEQN